MEGIGKCVYKKICLDWVEGVALWLAQLDHVDKLLKRKEIF